MSAKRAAKLVRRAKRKATTTLRRRVRAAGFALAKRVIAERVAEVRKEEAAP